MAGARRPSKRRVVREAAPVFAPRRLLLDTHVWLWWGTGDRRLGREARALIKHSKNIHISLASTWEIAIKRSTGKLPVKSEQQQKQELERDGFTPLPITLAH